MSASLVYKNRKWERPFSSTQALHLVLRTKVGGLRSQNILNWLRFFLPEKAKYFGVRLFHFAILDGHLHLLIYVREKAALNGFLRVVSGVIARRVLGGEKNNPRGIKMWEKRPYSRVLSWGREFKNVLAYIERNALEGAKRIPYIVRKLTLTPGLRARIALSLTRQPCLQI